MNQASIGSDDGLIKALLKPMLYYHQLYHCKQTAVLFLGFFNTNVFTHKTALEDIVGSMAAISSTVCVCMFVCGGDGVGGGALKIRHLRGDIAARKNAPPYILNIKSLIYPYGADL